MAGRPPGDSADGKFRLLDACWSLLEENDPGERLTIAAVCERAKCTPPTLYHHFGDLASLEHAASVRAFTQWSEVVAAEVAKQDDPRKRLRHYAHAYLAWAIDNPDAYTVMFSRPGQLGHQGSGPRFDLVAQAFSAIHSRDIDDPRVIAMSLAFWVCLHGASTLAIAAPGVPQEAEDDTIDFIESALNAYGPPDAHKWASDLLDLQAEPAIATKGRRARRF